MKLALSAVLLASLFAPSSRSESSQIVVAQTPEVKVTEGATLNISCCWTCAESVWIKWRSDKGLQQDQVKFRNTSQQFPKDEKCTFLTIENITQAHSGKYVCEVIQEIPKYKFISGNGTVVMVTPRDHKKNNTVDTTTPTVASGPSSSALVPVSASLAVLVPLLAALLIFFCLQRRRREMAARVIYEVPHMDSDVDKHSTGSSTGSSQWCQVLVYESVDYFQHVEKKQGDEL